LPQNNKWSCNHTLQDHLIIKQAWAAVSSPKKH
jgi:hypothetical protein